MRVFCRSRLARLVRALGARWACGRAVLFPQRLSRRAAVLRLPQRRGGSSGDEEQRLLQSPRCRPRRRPHRREQTRTVSCRW